MERDIMFRLLEIIGLKSVSASAPPPQASDTILRNAADAPQDSSDSSFKPIQTAKDDLANKLQELKKIQNDFFTIQSRIFSKLEVEHKLTKAVEVTAEKTKVTVHANDPEKVIEMAIMQAKLEIAEDMALLKSEAKEDADYLQKCAAGIAVIEKLNSMIYKIHIAMSEPLQNAPPLREQIEASLTTIVSIVPERPILQKLLNAIKIANVLLKKSQSLTDEKLYLEIDKGIAETTQFLNQDFRELHNVRDLLQQKYLIDDKVLLSPARNSFTQFGIKADKVVVDASTQTDLTRRGSCQF